jgi:cytochrome c biogenesis protein CcmG, thiol:disulfide interchange protein DsbE
MSSSVTTEGTPTADGPVPDGGPPPVARARPIFLVVGVVMAGILAVILFVGFRSSPGSSAAVPGSPVPTFMLDQVGVAGHTVGVPTDGGGDGKPAILLFFASWCGPCQAEVPALAAAYNKQHATDSRLNQVKVVGVDDLDPNAAAFVASNHVKFPVGSDPTSTVSDAKFAFGTLPESVFVSAQGTIVKIHYGALSTTTFVKWEKKLLATA